MARALRYRSFTRQYFRNASAAVLMYDITSPASFDGMQRWHSELSTQAEFPPGSLVVVIVGSKADKEAERRVAYERAHEFARAAGAMHLECSSKDGSRCEDVFTHIAGVLAERGLTAGASSRVRASTSGAPVLVRELSVSAQRAGCACL